MDGIRLGLIGCGRLAEQGYLPVLAGSDGVELAAAADPDPARRAEIGRRVPGLRLCESAEELCADGTLDGAIIASPAATHLAAAERAATAGIPTLVEKPPAESAASARVLAALEPRPAIGFNRRFGLGAGLAEAVAASPGPVDLELAISYRRRSWDPVGELGDALADLGPHLADLALLAAGEDGELAVTATASAATRFSLELEGSGLRARLRGRTDRPHRECAVLRGPAGEVRFERRQGGLAGLLRRRAPHPLHTSLAAQLDAWLDAIGTARDSGHRDGRDGGPLAEAVDGVRVMELLERARRGSATGAPEPTPASAGGPGT